MKWGSLALYFLLMAGWFWGSGRYAKLIAITGVLTFLLGLISFSQRGPTTEPFTLAVAPHVPTHDHLLLHYQNRKSVRFPNRLTLFEAMIVI
ncbi:MAG: hypothetical protein M5U34_32390 [Chloroflexi bacterium]|nr:hypothetical protein [Chloroflexota bacterium]